MLIDKSLKYLGFHRTFFSQNHSDNLIISTHVRQYVQRKRKAGSCFLQLVPLLLKEKV